MGTKNIIFLIAALLVAGGLIGFFLVQRGTVHVPSPQEGKSAPELSFKDYNGREVNLSDFRGKALVVNAWAAWCPFCREELPAFATVQKEFGDKLAIVAIDRAESLVVAKGYTDQQGTTNSLIFLLDPSHSFYKSIGGFSMPETIFVDGAGVTQFHKRGPMAVDEIRERVKTIIAASPATQTLPNDNVNPTAIKPESQSTVVMYDGFAFSPRSLRVKSGTTVTFRNDSTGSLWVASDPHPIHTNYSGFDARKSTGAGGTYSFTFTKIGAWGYHNHLNAGQKGEVIVE